MTLWEVLIIEMVAYFAFAMGLGYYSYESGGTNENRSL